MQMIATRGVGERSSGSVAHQTMLRFLNAVHRLYIQRCILVRKR